MNPKDLLLKLYGFKFWFCQLLCFMFLSKLIHLLSFFTCKTQMHLDAFYPGFMESLKITKTSINQIPFSIVPTVNGSRKFLFFFNFILFFKLYITVLVLPNIKMNPPQVYMCSPS